MVKRWTVERWTVERWTVEREFSHLVHTRAGDPDDYITLLISCSHVLEQCKIILLRPLSIEMFYYIISA